MRTIIAALALALLLAYQVINIYGEQFLAQFSLPLSNAFREEAGWIIFAWALCLYLVIEGCYSLIVNNRRSKSVYPAAAVKLIDKGSTQESSNQSVQTLESELHSAEEMITSLQVKLKEAEEVIQQLEDERDDYRSIASQLERTLEGRERDLMVDAEIVQLLAKFQEKGRLIDFVMDDITPYDDPQVGAAARVVHRGCKEVLNEFFQIDAVYAGREGDPLTLENGFPSESYRLIGRVPNAGPYLGKVRHKGWKATDIRLPRLMQSEDGNVKPHNVIAPAQVEV